MGYRIIYDTEDEMEKKIFPAVRLFFTVFFLLIFWCSVSAFWPEGKAVMLELLIPGDPERSIHVLEVFAGELECGFSWMDAGINFVKNLISDGL